ncbi:hypothetical protein [Vibrio cholerae]|uniref:hypothetical protein n=1 Tax=Vibrio cholerae TaxID=666 RepID=UPI00118360A8|nr:hypothetical protein [Vibrio cholerae]MBJ6953104.1 hypothetical protein [Vibrio cholerae]TVN18933.1 hypothetical protein FPW20_07835 [Vibrio cholerae]
MNQKNNELYVGRELRRPGYKVKDIDSFGLMTKTGANLEDVALQLDANPIMVMVTEVFPGGASKKHPGETLPQAARLNCIAPEAVHYRHNQRDVNVRTARKHNYEQNTRKTLALSRGAGQGLFILRAPGVSPIEAAEDLKSNGIQFVVSKVAGNRQARINVSASDKWLVVRSELYNPHAMLRPTLSNSGHQLNNAIIECLKAPASGDYEYLIEFESQLVRVLNVLAERGEVKSDNAQTLYEKLQEVQAKLEVCEA